MQPLRKNMLVVKLSEAEQKKLQEIMGKLDKTKSEAVRFAIKNLYNEIILR